MNHQVFLQRRKEFMSRLNGGVAILPSAPVRSRNGDVDYEYRQDSDFYYLTGYEEPDSVCVLAPGHSRYEYVLFVRPRDKEQEVWTGIRSGVEGAVQNFGAEMAFTNDRFHEELPQLLENAPSLFYRLNKNPEMDRMIHSILESMRQRQRLGIHPPSQIVDPAEILGQMRLIKKPDEIEDLQKAVEISARGHVAAMKAARPGMSEYQVQAVLEYAFRSNGSVRNGYPSIFASGPHTCILHYTENRRVMDSSDLLLIDAGAEFNYFTGDITRTFPVSGSFSPEQKAVYEIVLDAQKKAMEMARPGASFADVHAMALYVLTDGMISLGLLTGSVDENIESQGYKKYYYHRTSHWLGMDVHDVGRYRTGDKWTVLEPGMVITIEPGLYISSEDEHEKFRNIGVRIEDDVLITPEGCRNLSASCPKEIQDLENIIGTGQESLL